MVCGDCQPKLVQGTKCTRKWWSIDWTKVKKNPMYEILFSWPRCQTIKVYVLLYYGCSHHPRFLNTTWMYWSKSQFYYNWSCSGKHNSCNGPLCYVCFHQMDGSWLTPRANHVCTWLSHTTLESKKKVTPKLILHFWVATWCEKNQTF